MHVHYMGFTIVNAEEETDGDTMPMYAVLDSSFEHALEVDPVRLGPFWDYTRSSGGLSALDGAMNAVYDWWHNREFPDRK